MFPEFGQFSLILALCVAGLLSTLPFLGVVKSIPMWIQFARPAATLQFFLVLLAFVSLAISFVTNDFSVAYVAANSNSQLPVVYRFAAVWGAHEGSFLLWLLLLCGWTLAVAWLPRHLPSSTRACILSILGSIVFLFLLFLILTSNPFERLWPAQHEGRDLNPLLQDPGLVIHPPILYMGYVGFSVAFAFAMTSLLQRESGMVWVRRARPWVLAAWLFLTLGIALGSAWAYYVLGWGGWWFWDPVENASFIPWLVGAALIHSLAVTEKRGAFTNWSLLLAIATFSLSLLGTFLVRSGVLTSVHAFASDPQRGVFILLILGVVIGCSLVLFALRAVRRPTLEPFALLSKETLLLINNIFLTIAAATVLFGTLYPLIIDALGLGKLSVGPPYFDLVFVPLMVPLLLLMPYGPITNWRRGDGKTLLSHSRWTLLLAFIGAALIPWIYGRSKTLLPLLGAFLACWLLLTIVEQILRRLMQKQRLNLGQWGMYLAHAGVGVFVLGVTVVTSYQIEKDVRLDAGSTITLGDYQLQNHGLSQVQGPNYQATRATLTLRQHGQPIGVLTPEKRFFQSSPQMPMTDAAILRRISGDIYVALGNPLPNNAWSMRVHYKPLVNWIWGGCLMMALGALLAIFHRRKN